MEFVLGATLGGIAVAALLVVGFYVWAIFIARIDQ